MTIRTGLSLEDFDEFFSTLNDGHLPYSWQRQLLERLVETGNWPEQISAPTGAGKSSVVDIHVFANALHADGLAPRLPRRLHAVVNRRGLVDNQYGRGARIQQALEASLKDQNAPEVLQKVALALAQLGVGKSTKPLNVSVLRGGLSTQDLPVNDLSVCTVIASTPDMWGSRALFQGYGATYYARSREATLMTSDSVLVLDEAQLNKQLLKTARRIREIQLGGVQIGVPALQVVETTATPSTEADPSSAITVTPENLETGRDDTLRQRLYATKQIHHEMLPKWNGRKSNSSIINTAVDSIQSWLSSPTQTGTLGCIVNHVDTALKISSTLRKAKVRVEVLVGPMRPYDLQRLTSTYPGLLSPHGNDEIDVIVATQTLEVGVDVDFQHLVTELAPATSLQQRIGRLNRLGKYDASELIVLEPTDETAIRNDSPPYTREDLLDGLRWIREFEEGTDVNPARLLKQPAPPTRPSRLLHQRLEFREVELLAKSSEHRESPFELDLWLHDSLDTETPVAGIAVRYGLPEMQEAAVELLNQVPPRAFEVFPATISIVRRHATYLTQLNGKHPVEIPLFIYHAGEVSIYTDETRVCPGDVLIVGKKLPLTTEGVVVETIEDKKAPDQVSLDDTRIFVYGQSNAIPDELFREAQELTPEDFMSEWIEHFPDDYDKSVEISVASVEDHRGSFAAWILVREKTVLQKNPETIQEWTNAGPPTIEQHQLAVAQRVKELCARLGVDTEYSDRIATACRLHDEGKRDSRFQHMLGNSRPDVALAKSKKRSKQEVSRSRAGSGLPTGWRHEQFSAVIAEDMRSAGDTRIDELVVHIIGTSHGRGRDLFPQIGEQVVTGSSTADRLFSEGQWESQVRHLTRELGAYTLALCESLERAADGQISGEGR
ncbi:type I-G CRISPR-associated helicase/endonuclease Cas3g [Corynebacterium glucuronolyticum]